MLFRFFNTPISFVDNKNKFFAKNLDILIIVDLNNIRIYTKDKSQGHKGIVERVMDLLKKNKHFEDLAKCLFHKNKVCF